MRFARFRASVLAVGLASIVSVVTAVPGLAATSTVTVTPASLSATSWYFYDDTSDIPSTTQDPAHYKFVTGPGTPPAGFGSVFFHDDNPNCPPGPPSTATTPLCQRWDIATSQFGGTPLSSLTALKFNTFEPTGEAAGRAVYLNFDVDFGPGVCPPSTCASVSGYQRRLVYVPSANGTVTTNTWQEWDTTVSGALWTWSGYDTRGGTWPDGNTNRYRTWSDILSTFSQIRVNNGATSSQLVFRAGEPYQNGFTGYLDKVTVGIGSNTTIFDFELLAAAVNKDDCKGGGWQNLRRADGSTFKNQGDCVSYTNNGR